MLASGLRHSSATHMKTILVAAALLLGACNRSSAPVLKLAEPQREALEKARGVEQLLQKRVKTSSKISAWLKKNSR